MSQNMTVTCRRSASRDAATAGRGDMMDWPATYDDMHPAAHNAEARLAYMDEMGIWSMVMVPSLLMAASQRIPRGLVANTREFSLSL